MHSKVMNFNGLHTNKYEKSLTTIQEIMRRIQYLDFVMGDMQNEASVNPEQSFLYEHANSHFQQQLDTILVYPSWLDVSIYTHVPIPANNPTETMLMHILETTTWRSKGYTFILYVIKNMYQHSQSTLVHVVTVLYKKGKTHAKVLDVVCVMDDGRVYMIRGAIVGYIISDRLNDHQRAMTSSTSNLCSVGSRVDI
jgi:hypothetical protein